jgi:hypothetical protein
LHTLTLSLAACLIVVARHLQGQLEQQLLHRSRTILATPSAAVANSDRSTRPGTASLAPLLRIEPTSL